MSGQQQDPSPEERRDERQMLHRLHLFGLAFGLVRIALCGAIAILVIDQLEPIARIFADKDTSLVLDINFAYSVTAAGAGGAGWIYGLRQRRRAARLEARLRDLERPQPDPSNTDDNA